MVVTLTQQYCCQNTKDTAVERGPRTDRRDDRHRTDTHNNPKSRILLQATRVTAQDATQASHATRGPASATRNPPATSTPRAPRPQPRIKPQLLKASINRAQTQPPQSVCIGITFISRNYIHKRRDPSTPPPDGSYFLVLKMRS